MKLDSTFSKNKNKNSFVKKYNRFLKGQEFDSEVKFSCIEIESNFKSIDYPEEFFINKIGAENSPKYKILKDICKVYNNKGNIMDKFLEAEEIIPNQNTSRLLKIISKNIGENLPREVIYKLQKFKSKEDIEIQWYFCYGNKILKLYLIDIYHLAIVAKEKGRYTYQLKYLNKKGRTRCISEILSVY